MFNPIRADDWKQFGKRNWIQLLVLQTILVFAAGVFVTLKFVPSLATHRTTTAQHSETVHDANASHVGQDSDADRGKPAPQWWTCAMHPQIRQQKPGKCPLCQMELVPVKPSAGGLRTLTIKPSVKQLMKVETSPVERKYVTADIRMAGKVEYDETRLAHITAWVSGRLDRLYVDYAGVHVKKGDHMVYIYSEELYSIQGELISAIRFQRENPARLGGGLDLAEAVREKLRLLGLTDTQIKEIEQRDKADDHVTIYSPAGGIVIEKLKQEGDRVRTGDRIYTVADLSQLWVKLDAYESDLAWIRYGQKVTFTTEAYPGEKFVGRIALIDPILNKESRTVKVRVNVENKAGRLKPEMFVRAVVSSNVAAGGRVMDAELAGKWISPMHPEIVKDQPGNCDICGMPLVRAESLGYVPADTDSMAKPLVIPASATLITGTRAIVYVEVAGANEPTYEGREVLLGPRAGDYYLVRNGLFDGEMVVTNGNFKIDSALQIQARPTMMTPQGGGGGGHDHGGGDKKAAQVTMPAIRMKLPKGFQSQLHELMSSGRHVLDQTRTNDIDLARQAFTELKQSLNLVNAEGLDDHPAMLWKEFLMLLGNDAIEGSEATNMEAARLVEASLRVNISRMGEQFMLSNGDHGTSSKPATSTFVVSDDFKNQLSGFVTTYLRLQTALAADDGNQAGQVIGSIQTALASINDQFLAEPAKSVWLKEKQQFEQIATRLAAANDIAASRAEFALLSDQLLAVVRQFGTGDENLYELHCPMAFDGRGATWIQDNDQTRNPYFGASMLTCADRVNKIESKQTDAETRGHQHE